MAHGWPTYAMAGYGKTWKETGRDLLSWTAGPGGMLGRGRGPHCWVDKSTPRGSDLGCGSTQQCGFCVFFHFAIDAVLRQHAREWNVEKQGHAISRC